jgi:hypothetical protein
MKRSGMAVNCKLLLGNDELAAHGQSAVID